MVQLLGISWLIFIGFQKFFSNEKIFLSNNSELESNNQDIWRGIITAVIISITNPKVLVFYFSVYAQYLQGTSNFFEDQIFLTSSILAIVIAYGGYSTLGAIVRIMGKKFQLTMPIGRVSGVSYWAMALYFGFQMI